SYRALAICESCVEDRTSRLQPLRVLDRYARRYAVINGDLTDVGYWDEKASILDKLLEIGDPDYTHAAAHVGSRVGRVAKVGSNVGFEPRYRIAPHRRPVDY